MKKKLYAAIIGLTALATLATPSNAETLLGKNYIGASFSAVQYGDVLLDDLLGTGYIARLRGKINLTPNIDLALGLGHQWTDGKDSGLEVDVSASAAGASLIYFWNTNETVSPYLGAGFNVIHREVEISSIIGSTDEDDTELGGGVAVGIEVELSEQTLLNFSLDYFYIDDNDSVDLNLGLGYWFNQNILGRISGSYDLDNENTIGSIGFVVTH